MSWWLFTFGYGHVPSAPAAAMIFADNASFARMIMFERFGGKWSQQYDELEAGHLFADKLARIAFVYHDGHWLPVCSCGRWYSISEWRDLAAPPAGMWQDMGDEKVVLELRNCAVCRSTIAREVTYREAFLIQAREFQKGRTHVGDQ